MSLRRSTRVSSKPVPVQGIHIENVAAKAPPPKKRGRKSKSSGDDVTTAAVQGDAAVTDGSSTMPPPLSTPNKRRKVAKAEAVLPPITPTPSAIGLMTSTSGLGANYSTGDIDDVTPPPPRNRPAEPHHTNATLITPGGTQVEPTYSNFEESPSKPGSKATTATACLLDDACAHLIKADRKLKTLLEKFPCRVFSPEGLAEQIDPFRSLTSGIMAQQVSGAAARSIKNKFIALFPAASCPTGFPPPSLVAGTSIPRLREAGLSQRKAEYIQGLAEKFANGELTVKMLMEGSDEEVMEKLVAVRGLGAWSVQMFMCFGLKRTDIFSTGDLGVQRGMAAYVGRDVSKLKAKGGGKWKYMSEKDMLDISAKFSPYRWVLTRFPPNLNHSSLLIHTTDHYLCGICGA